MLFFTAWADNAGSFCFIWCLDTVWNTYNFQFCSYECLNIWLACAATLQVQFVSWHWFLAGFWLWRAKSVILSSSSRYGQPLCVDTNINVCRVYHFNEANNVLTYFHNIKVDNINSWGHYNAFLFVRYCRWYLLIFFSFFCIYAWMRSVIVSQNDLIHPGDAYISVPVMG